MNKWLYQRTLRERSIRNDLIAKHLELEIGTEWVNFSTLRFSCLKLLSDTGWGHVDLYDAEVSVWNMLTKLTRENIIESLHEPGKSHYRKKP